MLFDNMEYNMCLLMYLPLLTKILYITEKIGAPKLFQPRAPKTIRQTQYAIYETNRNAIIFKLIFSHGVSFLKNILLLFIIKIFK